MMNIPFGKTQKIRKIKTPKLIPIKSYIPTKDELFYDGINIVELKKRIYDKYEIDNIEIFKNDNIFLNGQLYNHDKIEILLLPKLKSKKEVVLSNNTCMHIQDFKLADNLALESGSIAPDFADWVMVTSCATEFVTNELLKTSDIVSQMRMVDIVRTSLDAAVDRFSKDMKIDRHAFHVIFKGGNVMRFIVSNLMAQNQSLFAYINEQYMNVFKPSDLDFGITFDDNFFKQKKLSVDDIHVFSEYVEKELVSLRDKLTDNAEENFPLLNMSYDVSQELLKNVFVEMNDNVTKHNTEITSKEKEGQMLPQITHVSTLSLNFPSNYPGDQLNAPSVRKDMQIQFSNEEKAIKAITENNKFEPKRIVCESRLPPRPLFISRNESLFFARNEKELIHFDLVRMKLAFSLTTVDKNNKESIKRIGGEVIDVSIPHMDVASKNFPQFTTLSKNRVVKTYQTYTLKTLQDTYSIESYSISGLIYDLIRVIFLEIEKPWSDSKYEKRLTRIMGLLLCEAIEERSYKIPNDFLIELMEITVTGSSNAPENTIWKLVQTELDRVRSLKLSNDDKEKLKNMFDKLMWAVQTNIKLLMLDEKSYSPYNRTLVR